MNYIKVIRISGSFFAREFDKRENLREVNQKTVRDQFLKGNATVCITFEDIDKEDILIDEFSDSELIKKYLGKEFIK